ncbi:TPA: hypothetical protein G8W61_005325 [Salmonella enterica]|uniref:Uncharacterized protein n=1 Tax=Salmonella enterica TaxID=28901 RepID=A0A759YLG4_SALER|nr:hypothetical protein [Salmonella enterica]
MKLNKFSLKQSCFLISVILLAPEIQAESGDSVLFNYYSGSDLFNRESRMGLQAKACHSLGDPINISFKLGRMFPAPEITLDIKGKNYSKSYSVFSGGIKNKSGAGDASFDIPFKITKNGSATGQSFVDVVVQKTAEYKDRFCFHPDFRDNSYIFTNGYIPIYENENRYTKLCGSHYLGSISYVWGGDPLNTPASQTLKDNVGIRTGVVYFKTFEPGSDLHNELEVRSFLGAVNDNGQVVSEVSNYVLPIQSENAKVGYTTLDSADFSYSLSNRNITELKLVVKSQGFAEYKWEWVASDDNPNILHLKYTNPIIEPIISPVPNDVEAPTDPSDSNPPNPAKTDPYNINSFYAKNDFYKGTLAGKDSLNQQYENYNSVMPLSLPPDSAGDINLVNTDSLSFTLRTPANKSQGYIELSAFGQPLQFAPLKYKDKEIASAMQMRNACY